VGALAAGVLTLSTYFASSLKPSWPSHEAAGNFLPIVDAALSPLLQYLLQTTLLLLVFTAVDRFTNGWTKKQALFSALLILLGLFIAGSRSVETLPIWLLSGLLAGAALLAAYVFVLRFNLGLVPLAVALVTVLGELKQGIAQPIPAALPGALIAMVLAGFFAFYWFKQLQQER
jgi:hypothetical protein